MSIISSGGMSSLMLEPALSVSKGTNLLIHSPRKGTCRNQVQDQILYSAVGDDAYPSVGHGEAAAKLQRDWLVDPQTLPFAQRIKTHALVSLVQKGLLYHQIEQSVGQVSRRRMCLHFPFLRLDSQDMGRHHRRQRFILALSPLRHHLYPIETQRKILHAAHLDNANMAESRPSTGWGLFCPLKHQPPSEAAAVTVPTHRPTAKDQATTTCKSIPISTTMIRTSHQSPRRLLIIRLEKMGTLLMAWTSMMTPTHLAAPLPRTN